jgi:SAM-dependent methyltransferase
MRTASDHTDVMETAADMAAVAALLEIADRLGIMPVLSGGDEFGVTELANAGQLPGCSARNYLEAAAAANIVVETGEPGRFRAADDLPERVYQSGYLSWALNANRPFIERAGECLRSSEPTVSAYSRDGRQVAVSSQWMGSFAFYPLALATLVGARPRHVVDLGAGTGRLLIEVLNSVPDSRATAVDIDASACEAARAAAAGAGVGDRLDVLVRPIQSIADDPAPVLGADAIHAGFVFHDLMPEEEDVADAVLRNCHDGLSPGGILAITEAVPYVQDERERRFSAIVTYYHQQFMRRRLLTVEEWQAKLADAGFGEVTAAKHRFPTGRMFVARKC